MDDYRGLDKDYKEFNLMLSYLLLILLDVAFYSLCSGAGGLPIVDLFPQAPQSGQVSSWISDYLYIIFSL